MKVTNTNITLKDERTDKNYVIQCDEEHREYALNKLRERMDYDYIESLPAKDRANKKKKSIDFTCPFCLKNTKVTLRKEKVINGFLFFIHTELIDIYKCSECNKEFRDYELNNKKSSIVRQNNVIENFENWRDSKRDGKNPPEFMSLDRISDVIISNFP